MLDIECFGHSFIREMTGGSYRGMKLFICASITTLLFLSFAFNTNAEILVRVDEQGKKVFYNPAPKVTKTKIGVTTGKEVPLRFSKNASDYSPLIDKACKKYSVDPDLVKAVIQVESAYKPNALSRAGAIGLMQLMPSTASRFGVKEIYDPHENVHGGVQYLRFLLDLFKNDLSLAVAAYNAGEGAVQRYKGIPRYTETQNYVKRVLSLYGKADYVSKSNPRKVQTATSIYKYVDGQGVVHFTTQRPKAGATNEIKLGL